MFEKIEKQEEIELCEKCNYIYTKKDLIECVAIPCPKCGEWEKIYGTKITTSKIYIK